MFFSRCRGLDAVATNPLTFLRSCMLQGTAHLHGATMRAGRQNFLTNWTNKQQDKKANDSGKRSIGKA
jgi:hypothetical protein